MKKLSALWSLHYKWLSCYGTVLSKAINKHSLTIFNVLRNMVNIFQFLIIMFKYYMLFIITWHITSKLFKITIWEYLKQSSKSKIIKVCWKVNWFILPAADIVYKKKNCSNSIYITPWFYIQYHHMSIMQYFYQIDIDRHVPWYLKG